MARLLAFLVLFLATAPSDGRYGFVSEYLGVNDGQYRLLRYAAGGALALGVLLTPRTSLKALLAKYWPIWLMLASNFATVLFARDPDWTLRQSAVAFATASTAVLGIEMLLRRSQVLPSIGTWSFGTSLILIVLAPSVSTISPFLQAAGAVGDAGSWLGVFTSKNELGHASGLICGVLLASALTTPTRWQLQLVPIACAALCLYGSSSASGVVLLALAMATALVLRVLSAGSMPMIKIVAVVILALAMTFSDQLLNLGLSALNKDSSLTGRTDIWSWGWLIIVNNFPEGLGYGQSWTPSFTGEVTDLFSVVHLHNGFIELIVNNGAWGVLWLAMVAYVLIQGVICVVHGRSDPATRMWVVTLVCWLASALTEPNAFRPSGFLSIVGYLALAAILYLRNAESPLRSHSRQESVYSHA